TTLYAKWNAVYTVTFEVNGGSAVTAVTVENGEAVTAPANPTKAGYAFKGWYTDEELTTAYNFEAAVTGNLTVYAKWNAALTVTFDTKGGSAVADQAIESGEVATEPSAPTKAEHTFGGWYKDENCTEAFDFSVAITANTTVYAKWTIVTYTVTFDTDGGSAVTAATVDSGSVVTKPEDPAKSGYTFGGWYKDAERTEAFDFTVGITADTTLYAKWEVAVTTYAFTVNVTGEGDVLGKPYGEVNAGSVITLTFVPADGYELSSVKVNGTETEVEDLKLDITVNAAVTVEVVYSEITVQPQPDDDGLSTGAIVAICVCSACVVIGAGVATFFVIKKRKGNS
ncbi:MAG: InlB B-repeat-containing protein, partial [Clostridiales bacterium]|nr:InlB B-repeat-containing protein [Clostridiales bacterium]